MGVGGQHHAPAALHPGKTRYPLYRRLSGPQDRSELVRKISPLTGIRSPDRPARSESPGRHAIRITAAKVNYARKTAGCTWTDYETNTEIEKELNMTPGLDKIQEYRRNWIWHLNRKPRNRLPRIIKNYRPRNRKNQGRPLKRILYV